MEFKQLFYYYNKQVFMIENILSEVQISDLKKHYRLIMIAQQFIVLKMILEKCQNLCLTNESAENQETPESIVLVKETCLA